MKKLSKHFAALGIRSHTDPFKKTQWTLTITYIVAIIVIVGLFSIALYMLYANNLQEGFRYDMAVLFYGPEAADAVIQEALRRLRTVLVIVDVAIIAISAFASYYIAGVTMRPIKKVTASKRQFVADAAHELRTPLSVIKTGIDVMRNQKTVEKKEYEELLNDIYEESDYLIDLSEDLLFLANTDDKKESDRMKEHMEKIDLYQLSLEQVHFYEDHAREKQVRLSCKKEGDVPVCIHGNKTYITRMIANFIKNAIEYNKENGAVDLLVHMQEDTVLLVIKDTGSGMTLDEQKHIFERFYRSDSARTTSQSGSGLGLSIARTIIDAHGGTITVESAVDHGTTFHITFPREK